MISSLHNITGRSPSDYSIRTSIIRSIVSQIVYSSASPRYSTLRRLPLELSIDAVIAVAEGMKQDLQREANRSVLRNNLNLALGALASINAIDDFVYRLKIRSGSQLGLPKPPRPLTKSPLRKHLELEGEREKFLRANGKAEK